MQSPEQRPYSFDSIAQAQRKPATRGQEECSNTGQSHSDDGNPVNLLAPEKKQRNRHEDHIQTGNKTGVSGRGV